MRRHICESQEKPESDLLEVEEGQSPSAPLYPLLQSNKGQQYMLLHIALPRPPTN